MQQLRIAIRTGLLTLIVLLMADVAQANPIWFEHTGKGYGTIGDRRFDNAAFTIYELALTTDRRNCTPRLPRCWTIPDFHARISIEGIGSFTFLDRTASYVNQVTGGVGFHLQKPDPEDPNDTGRDLWHGPVDEVFADYDLMSSIGPISGIGELIQWRLGPPVLTDGGILSFNDGLSRATFRALVLPEPSVFLLVIAGLAGAGAAPPRRPNGIHRSNWFVRAHRREGWRARSEANRQVVARHIASLQLTHAPVRCH